MEFTQVNPEVIVGLGNRTVFTDKSNTQVENLHIQLEDWLGDDLMEIHPCFVVTKPLADALRYSDFTGFEIANLQLTKDRYFSENYSLKKPLPPFHWLKINGEAYTDDFGIDPETKKLTLSEKLCGWLKQNFTLLHLTEGRDFSDIFIEEFLRKEAENNDGEDEDNAADDFSGEGVYSDYDTTETSGKKIGAPGDPLNDSMATRAANIQPDLEHIHLYDEALNRKWKKFAVEALFAILAVAAICVLFAMGYGWRGSLFPIVILFAKMPAMARELKYSFSRQGISPEAPYTQGLLIPAVVVSINPIRIVAMADIRSDNRLPLVWGFCCMNVKNLPHQSVRVGEHVPCGALFIGSENDEVYSGMMVHPLCWATSDQQQIRDAIQAIDPKEWDILEKTALKIVAHPSSDPKEMEEKVIYFNSDLQECDPDDLPGYPNELLQNIYWSFQGGKYDTYSSFAKEVAKYNEKLDNQHWGLEDAVFLHSRLYLEYSYWNKNKEDETEEEFILEADNEKSFSAGELLFKIHNRVVDNLEEEDYHFFEGLSLSQGSKEEDPDAPVYMIRQGVWTSR